jgi:hypothetical protein
MRELICPAIEFLIGELLILEFDGDGAGRSLYLGFEQFVNALVFRVVGFSIVPFG